MMSKPAGGLQSGAEARGRHPDRRGLPVREPPLRRRAHAPPQKTTIPT